MFLVAFAVLTLKVGGCTALPTVMVPTPMTATTATPPPDGWAELQLRTPYAYAMPLPPVTTTPLDGTYVKNVSRGGDQIPCRRCPPYPPAGGLWRLSLQRGTFRIYHAGTGWRSLGSYFVAGDRVSFFNDPHCTDAVGVYAWDVDPGELRLRQVEDTCGGDLRTRSLTAEPWLNCQPPSTEAATTDHWPRPRGCPTATTPNVAQR